MDSIYQRYDLQEVINASGRMTILGVSSPRAEVAEAVTEGLNHFFDIKQLVTRTGEHIARLLEVESAVVVSCASAGIAQSVAAVICQDDDELLINLHGSQKAVAREIVLPKGHNVNFGAPVDTMVMLGGGKVVEAGYANECTPAQLATRITTDTAAILYIKSHHAVQKSILTVQQAVEVARQHNVPLIVDAAAEENLRLFYQQGSDLVIYSGAKAIEGPTSGLVVGKQRYVEWVKKQSQGIGRAMKIGKEGILGLTRAIELYLAGEGESGQQMVERMQPFIDQLNTLPGISAKVIRDSAGRDIARTEITVDPSRAGLSASELIQRLKQGAIAIFFREYRANEGRIEVDVRSVSNAQLTTIYQHIQHQIKGSNSCN